MKKILLLSSLAFIFNSCDRTQPPKEDDLRNVEGTERHNVRQADSATAEPSNPKNTVSPEPPNKHGM